MNLLAVVNSLTKEIAELTRELGDMATKYKDINPYENPSIHFSVVSGLRRTIKMSKLLQKLTVGGNALFRSGEDALTAFNGLSVDTKIKFIKKLSEAHEFAIENEKQGLAVLELIKR